jgi:23S rRNA pseudouridine1911/1915/1917 synthase
MMADQIKILYEDKNYLAIDKPSGLLVHADGHSGEPTVVDWVLRERLEVKGVGEEQRLRSGEVIERPGIVHRLDADTSGVLIIAKNQRSFLHLKEQFKERKVQKIYNALVYGWMKEKSGIIDRPVGKSRKDFRLWSAQRGAKGQMREAITEYEVLNEGELSGEKVSLLEVRPRTGRTHQIRVHLKAIHHPIVCDSLYAPKQDCLGFSRLMLHAKSISFEKITGGSLEVKSELPEEYKVLA